MLTPGATKTHTYPLGTDKKAAIPKPDVKYGKTIYRVHYHAVMVQSGYGGTLNTSRQPRRYAWVFGDFQQLNLVEE